MRRPVRRVAVGPECVLTGGRARRIEQARLREQYERPFGYLASPRRAFRSGDLLHLAAQMDCTCAQTLRRPPRHGAVERPINLISAGAVAITLQAATKAVRKTVARHPQQLPRCDVAE